MFPLKGESKNIEAYFGMLFFYATKLRRQEKLPNNSVEA